MNGWEEVELSSVAELTGGYAFKSEEYSAEGMFVLRTLNIREDCGIDRSNGTFIPHSQTKQYERFSLKAADTLFVMVGATLGKVGFLREVDLPALLNQNMWRIRAMDGLIDPVYLHYCFRHYSKGPLEWASGSARGFATRDDYRKLKIPLPALPEQREIAAILGALDDKIEVNRKASATLEAMARALYRSWFVDFDPVWAKLENRTPAHMPPQTAAIFPDSFDDEGLPLGWRFGTLADVAMTARNGVKPEQIHPDTPYIGLEHMPRRSIALSDWGFAADVGSQKSGMLAGDFMFGKLRPYFHKVGVAPVDGICSTDIIVLRPKTPEWGGFVLSVISSDAFVEHTNSGSSGTRMPRTNWSDMAAYEMPLPTVAVAAAFEAIVKPWRDRIVAGIHENQTLAALRDSLLPRLMSGELRVGDARELAEDAP